MTHRTMRHAAERGVALVITLFLMATLSALAVSLMFLSQTETSASRNYKMMSEVRYAGEAGVHKAINYLINNYTPASTSSFDLTKSPVTCTSGCTHNTTTTCDASTLALAQSTGCIVLSPSGSNYPDSATVTAFNSAVQGSLTLGSGSVNPGSATVSYSAYAVLMSMETVDVYGGVPKTAQSWKIVGTGSTVSGAVPATLDVSAMLEQDVVDAQTYAVYATSGVCGAISIGGSAQTNSYNSQTASKPPVSSDYSNAGGNVGTNGNLNISNNAAAHLGGSLYTPRSGAGSCSSGNPDAVSGSGSAAVSGSMVHLAQSVTYPTPTVPPSGAPTVPTSSTTISTTSCMAGLLTGASNWGCSVSGTTLKISPLVTCGSPCYLTLGNVTVGSNTTLEVDAASGGGSVVMDVNSFKLGSNAVFNPGASPSPTTTVTVNIAGQSLGSTLPLDLSGGGNVNTNTYDPSRVQFLYAGTGEMDVVGNNTVAATIYAPNAAMKAAGSGTVFGSILSGTYTDTGGATLHYDSNLKNKFKTLGNYVMTSFSWRKY